MTRPPLPRQRGFYFATSFSQTSYSWWKSADRSMVPLFSTSAFAFGEASAATLPPALHRLLRLAPPRRLLHLHALERLRLEPRRCLRLRLRFAPRSRLHLASSCLRLGVAPRGGGGGSGSGGRRLASASRSPPPRRPPSRPRHRRLRRRPPPPRASPRPPPPSPSPRRQRAAPAPRPRAAPPRAPPPPPRAPPSPPPPFALLRPHAAPPRAPPGVPPSASLFSAFAAAWRSAFSAAARRRLLLADELVRQRFRLALLGFRDAARAPRR